MVILHCKQGVSLLHVPALVQAWDFQGWFLMVLEGIPNMAKLNTCPMHRIPNTLLDTPRICPNWGVFSRKLIKSILNIFEFVKTDNVLLSEIEFWWEARCSFFWLFEGRLFLQTKPFFHLPTYLSNTLKMLYHKCFTYLKRVFSILYDEST